MPEPAAVQESTEDELPPWMAFACPTCFASSGAPCVIAASCMARVLLAKPAASPVAGVSAEKVRKEFEGCITEIGANRTLAAKDEFNKGWNAASANAMKFIRNYIDGKGLFQSELAQPSAEGDGWIAELRDGLKLVRLALADENVDGVPTWTRMRFWLNQRDIYNGDLQEHRVTFEVVKRLLTLLPAPVAKEGRES
jgi:hypothetical protein